LHGFGVADVYISRYRYHNKITVRSCTYNQIGIRLYSTPGKMHSISNIRLAAVSAVFPLGSYGGDTYSNNRRKELRALESHLN